MDKEFKRERHEARAWEKQLRKAERTGLPYGQGGPGGLIPMDPAAWTGPWTGHQTGTGIGAGPVMDPVTGLPVPGRRGVVCGWPGGVVRRPGSSSIARAPELAVAVAWRHRWHTAPLAVAAAVMAASVVAPVWTGLALAGVTAVVWRWARSGRPVRTVRAPRGLRGRGPRGLGPLGAVRSGLAGLTDGPRARLTERMWLSQRERAVAAVWLATATVWAVWAAVPVLPAAGSPMVLAAALGWPTWQWWTSRTLHPHLPGTDTGLSEGALSICQRWATAVAVHGPAPLLGSRILFATFREPAEGAYAFTVQLAYGVHGQDAAGDTPRRAVEVQLRMPVGTATLAPDPDDATRLLVTLTPSKHLQTEAAQWAGPVLEEDGTIPVAVTPDGRTIAVGLFNPDGVEHAFIVGTSGAGKTSTTAVLALPGPAAGVETLWYADGKRGGSAPYLHPACDWYARSPEAWAAMVDAGHAVLTARKVRRGEQGLSRWDTPNEDEPILTLLFDEATTIAGTLKADRHAKVLEILREGRSLGVRLVQVAQDPMGTDLLGGRKARDLMTAAGCVIAHRIGGSLAGRIALDSTSDRTIDLTGLPPEPGFAAIIRKGAVLAKVARVHYASDTTAGDVARTITPRPLTGPDADAAGPSYADRRPAQTGGPTGPERRTETEQAAGAAEAAEPAEAHGPDQREGRTVVPGRRLVNGGPVPGPRRESGTSTRTADPGPDRVRAAEPLVGVVRSAKEAVAEALQQVSEPVTRGWLMRRTGLARATVMKALGDLEAEQRAERVVGQKWQSVP